MSQKFLLDDKKLGRLLKFETFEVNQIKKQVAISGKKQTVSKKKTLITIYNRVNFQEEIFNEDGTSEKVGKDKFIKWAEFSFSEVMHPKDRLIELFTKTERPLDYIPDVELIEEMTKRELANFEKYPDSVLINEMKRRGLTEFANNFKISKNATFGQKIVAFIKKRKKIPNVKLSYEDTITELKKRHLITPKDFLNDEELLAELQNRNLQSLLPVPIMDELFEDLPKNPEVIDPADISGLLTPQ